MICPRCNADVPDESEQCPSCGAPLDATTSRSDARAAAPDPPTGDLLLVREAPPSIATAHAARGELGFDVRRWSIADAVIGLASVVLAISLFLDWYTFQLPLGGAAARSGTWSREYLYAAFALSAEVVVYLAARSVWSGLQFKGRFGHHAFLIALTTGSLVTTLIAFVATPLFTQAGITIPTTLSYGAYIAVPAAAVAMVASVGQMVASLVGARSKLVTTEPELAPAETAQAQAQAQAQAPPPAQASMFCARCGAPHGPEDKVCAVCGASFEEAVAGPDRLGGHHEGGAAA